MNALTKSQRKHLRQIAGLCYEKEMSIALQALFEDFQKWKNSEITPWDLNDRIHKHHDVTARELWKIYEHINDPALAVAASLARGIIDIEDVQENCRELVERKIDVYNLRDIQGSTTK